LKSSKESSEISIGNKHYCV